MPNKLILRVLDFTKPSAGDIVDEAADGNGIRDPWMGAELCNWWRNVFIDVLEGVKKREQRRRFRCDSGFGSANSFLWYASPQSV